MDERTREVRHILMGKVTLRWNDMVITAADNLFEVRSDRIYTGSRSARYFGLRTEQRQYRISGEVEPTHEACRNAFACLGRQLHLFSAPDALGMLYTPAWHNPVVVTLEAEENQLLLCVYTAKTLLSKRNLAYALKHIGEGLPAGLTEIPVSMMPQCVGIGEEVQEEKEHKKRKRTDKKQIRVR